MSESLQLLGFEPGWGDTVERAWDTMNIALDILEAPDATTLDTFLSRIPNMFNVVILSPHGYFGQKDVLGKPDTGGQVRISHVATSNIAVLAWSGSSAEQDAFCACLLHATWYEVTSRFPCQGLSSCVA